MSQSPSRRFSRRHGLSLIEMIISLAISAMLLTAVAAAFVSSSGTIENNDQFFRFEGGSGKCIIDETEYAVKDGDVVVIPAGAKHNIINTDAKTDLKMYTLYGPPNHKDHISRATKEDAEKMKEEFDGKTTE